MSILTAKCSKCGGKFTVGQSVSGHESGTWHTSCPTPPPTKYICDNCHVDADLSDKECWNCGGTTFVDEPGKRRRPPVSEEPTIDWLIDQIAPNEGNSPLLNYNKKRLLNLVHKETVKARIADYETIFGEFGEFNLDGDIIVPGYIKSRLYYAIDALTKSLEGDTDA